MIDKNSPQYPAYVQECKQMSESIFDKMDELDKILESEHWCGKDHPEVSALYKELSNRIREIQKKYGF